MIAVDQSRVAASFDGADEYDRSAGVQRVIAQGLADRIAGLDLPQNPRILEIGCGTGFLTRALVERGVSGDWLITDKAPAMVARCREAVGEGAGRGYKVLDGEYGIEGLGESFDLVCASMTFQWFDDLETAVERLLGIVSAGGHLVFNTLADGTFREWKGALERCGLATGVVRFSTVDDLCDMLDRFAPESVDVEHHVERHRDAREFLLQLKQIGAATPHALYAPLPPGALKQAMAAFDAAGATATYELVTSHIAKGPA